MQGIGVSRIRLGRARRRDTGTVTGAWREGRLARFFGLLARPAKSFSAAACEPRRQRRADVSVSAPQRVRKHSSRRGAFAVRLSDSQGQRRRAVQRRTARARHLHSAAS